MVSLLNCAWAKSVFTFQSFAYQKIACPMRCRMKRSHGNNNTLKCYSLTAANERIINISSMSKEVKTNRLSETTTAGRAIKDHFSATGAFVRLVYIHHRTPVKIEPKKHILVLCGGRWKEFPLLRTLKNYIWKIISFMFHESWSRWIIQ